MILDLPPQTEKMLIQNAQNNGLAINDYLERLLKNDICANPMSVRFPLGLMQHHTIKIHEDFDEPLDNLFTALK